MKIILTATASRTARGGRGLGNVVPGCRLDCISPFHAIIEPHHLAGAVYTGCAAGRSIVVKERLFRFVLRESASVESSAVQTDAWHHRSDAITSLAAVIGITVSLVGGKGYEAADDFAADRCRRE